MRTRAAILTLGLATIAIQLHAQPKPQKDQPSGKQSGKQGGGGSGIVVPYQVVGQDTLPVCTAVLPGDVPHVVDSATMKKQWAWQRYKRNVSIAMHYARTLQDTLVSMEKRIASFDRKRDKKRYLREEEDKLRTMFEKQLKELTVNQGKLLVKLISRQTGKTTYQLIKQYKSGITARFWQVIANGGGVSIDQEYVASQEPELEEAIKELGLK